AFLAARPLDQPRQRDRALGRQRQRAGVDERQHALAREHETGARKTDEVGEGGDHGAACPLPRLRGRVGEGAHTYAGACCVPPPCPSPASGGGDANGTAAKNLTVARAITTSSPSAA